MSLIDKVDNKMKHRKSQHNEKKTIDGRMASIEDATDAAAEEIVAIGQYYWKRYIAGEYTPDEEIRCHFDNLDTINSRIRDLNREIDDLKIAGIKERENIDEETRRRILEREALKEEKARAKAEAKATKEEET